MKICKICKLELPLESFAKRSLSKDGKMFECRKCSSERAVQWVKDNREKFRENQKKFAAKQKTKDYRRDWALQKQYGVSLDEFKEMEKEQGGKCAICGIFCKLHLDHDHETGRIRGLLCPNCNKGLGLFFDNAKNLNNARKYLQNTKDENFQPI